MKWGGVSVFNVEAVPYPQRCDAPVTVTDGVWYVHFLSRRNAATLRGVRAPASANVLRTGQSASWKVEGDHITLTLPATPPADFDEVVEVKW
jgi:hypothetical protein